MGFTGINISFFAFKLSPKSIEATTLRELTMAKKLIIIRGLSGSGKTTLADIICTDEDSCVSISVDDYFYDEEDTYNFEAEHLKKAHEWCKQEVETCMIQSFETVVIHNTFTRKWEVDPYLELASSHQYEVMVVSLFDSGLNDHQLMSRSPHKIPLGSIRIQRRRWEHDVFRNARHS